AGGREARWRLARGGGTEDRTAAYFVEEARQIVEERFGEAVYTGGLRIYTTLDRRTQEVAEAELGRQLDATEAGAYGPYRYASYRPRRTPADTAAAGTPCLQGARAGVEGA